MSLTKLTDDLNIIQGLMDEPNDVEGLTSEELKAKFDEASNKIKAYINNILTEQIAAQFTSLTGDHEGTWQGYSPSQVEPGLSAIVNSHSTQLFGNINNVISAFSSMLVNGQITKINLYGDSITAGYDAVGTAQDPSGKVILNNGVDTFKETLTAPRCWANLFREFMASVDPSIIFTNKGIDGKSTKYFWNNKQYWTDATEDVVFLALGHNDLWDTPTLADFKTYYENTVDYLISKSNLLICLSPSPKGNEGVEGVNPNGFNIRDLDMVITEICKRKGIAHIRMNTEILDRLMLENKTFAQFLNDDNAHPSDIGHAVYWRTLQRRLGLANITNVDYNSELTRIVQPQTLIDLGISLDSDLTQFSFFDENSILIIPISSAKAPNLATPYSKFGTAIIYNTNAAYKEGFVHVKFISGEDDTVYTRTFKLDKTWTPWKSNFDKFNISKTLNTTLNLADGVELTFNPTLTNQINGIVEGDYVGGVLTIPKTGYYNISSWLQINVNSQRFVVKVYVNGVNVRSKDYNNTSVNAQSYGIDTKLFLNKNDTVSVGLLIIGGTASTSQGLPYTYLDICKDS